MALIFPYLDSKKGKTLAAAILGQFRGVWGRTRCSWTDVLHRNIVELVVFLKLLSGQRFITKAAFLLPGTACGKLFCAFLGLCPRT